MKSFIFSKAYTFCALISAVLPEHANGLTLPQAAPGCGIAHKPYQDGESRPYSINSSGGLREYNVHFPLNYDPQTKYPLMISYHGGTKTKEEQEQLTQFSNNSINPHMIAVYPQGIKISWQANFPYPLYLRAAHTYSRHADALSRRHGKAHPSRTNP